MNKGKDTCKTLKEIRRRIAEANGIDYSPTECSFKGECLGTCPACEQEIRFLEDKLAEKKRKGTRAKVAAVAAGICAVAMPQAVEAQTKTPMLGKVRITQNKADSINIYDLTTTKIGSVVVRGTVRDETNEPLIGATILCKEHKWAWQPISTGCLLFALLPTQYSSSASLAFKINSSRLENLATCRM